ncbi:hypothetical protein LSTR_LSTR000345 [Laodelphax striatellus]|uniref:Sodium channel protein Nach n=1 Tax=Laodelphax striatellus TaxID=195883 RepID=A0A482X4D9_LAOST|nr:hypothetical protein LSTR_LSTR000345 [Laodelphax striatellus]
MNQEVLMRVRELQPAKHMKKNQERKQRKGRKSVPRVLKNLALTYLQKSSIHGLKNLVNPNHNFYERLFLASVIIFCFLLACKNIVSCYYTYQQASQVSTLKSDKLDISNVPYPGVAVCNINPIKKSALVRMANRMKDDANLSFNDTYNALIYLNQVHLMGHVPRKQKERLNYILVKNGQSHNVTRLISELSHRCDDMLKSCFFDQIQIACKNLFMEAVVPGGHMCCVSKNSIIASDSIEAPIWKTSTSGESTGISINLELEIEEYLLPVERELPIQAAEVMIYDPRSHPVRMGLGVTSFLAGYKDITLISINPSVENNVNWDPRDSVGFPIRPIMAGPENAGGSREEKKEKYLEIKINRFIYFVLATGKDSTEQHDILEECDCPPACESIWYQSRSSTLIQDRFRLFSVSVILFCLILAYISMWSSYVTYKEGVQITIMTKDSLHLSSIPFPGIAVCNINAIKRSALVKMAHQMKDKAHMTFNETFQILSNLKNEFGLRYTPSKERELLKYVLEQNGQSNNLSGLLTELSHSCDDMLKEGCLFNSKIVPCKDLFMQSFLSWGRSCCVTKNSMISTHASGTDRPIWYLNASSMRHGLFVNLDLETEEYMSQPTILGPTFFGAEVIIFDARSHPTETSFGSSFHIASYGEVTLIQIDPEVENNTYSTGDYGSVCRRDIPLATDFNGVDSQIMLPYSFSECLFQCIINEMQFPQCQCYIYMHKVHGGRRECSLDGWECLFRNLDRRLRDVNYEYGFEEYILDQCKCLPACESILYKSTSSSLISNSQFRETNETHISIYYDKEFANLYERKPFYTFEQLLVQFIGLCSLFFGGSIVSIVELIYFITLRLLCELYTNQKPKKDEELKRLDMEEICEGTKEGKIYWNEILANID